MQEPLSLTEKQELEPERTQCRECQFDGDVWNARALIEKERKLSEAHQFSPPPLLIPQWRRTGYEAMEIPYAV